MECEFCEERAAELEYIERELARLPSELGRCDIELEMIKKTENSFPNRVACKSCRSEASYLIERANTMLRLREILETVLKRHLEAVRNPKHHDHSCEHRFELLDKI